MNKMNKKMNGDGRYEFNLLYSINMLGVLIGPEQQELNQKSLASVDPAI